VNKLRVLVVEDNPVVAGMIRHFLEKSHYLTAGPAATGEAAVEMAGELKPDLVLMDVQLAGEMDGIEATGLIWSQFQIPIVYLTANSDDETIARAASTGAYGYLHKPVQERELSSTLHIALSKHESDCRVQDKQNWLETTLKCIADAVIAADSAGCVQLINPAAEALTGWTQAEAVGRDVLDVYQALDRETRRPAECVVVQVIREGAASRTGLAKILVARNGTETMVRETAAPIVNGAGNILGVVVVLRVEGVS
jgi:PAS domain S-box-containing protein